LCVGRLHEWRHFFILELLVLCARQTNKKNKE